MSAKKKASGGLEVRTPEARAKLVAWFDKLDPATCQRGQTYYENGHVLAAWADADHYVCADVRGQETYQVTLFLTRGTWTSECSCPIGGGCKHTAAAALAWIASEGADIDEEPMEEDAFELPSAATLADLRSWALPPSAAKPADATRKKNTFREQWTAKLADKLGRPLTAEEGRLLGQLSALFNRLVQAWGHLRRDDLIHHGFGAAVPPGGDEWSPLFQGWWLPQSPPRDPWALWQFLAFSLERNGQPIPAVFQPMTDLAPVRQRIGQLLLRAELDTWRRALAAAPTPAAAGPAYVRANPAESIKGLRVRLDSKGVFLIEQRAASAKGWKTATQTMFRHLANAFGSDLEHLPGAERTLATLLATEARKNLYGIQRALPAELAGLILATPELHALLFSPGGSPLPVAPAALVREAVPSPTTSERLELRLVTPDGRDAAPAVPVVTAPGTHYFFEETLWPGPPPVPASTLPVVALAEPDLALRLRATGLRLPASLEPKIKRAVLRPLLRCWLEESKDGYSADQFFAHLIARSDDPPCAQTWAGFNGWQWCKDQAPPPRRPDDPFLELDLSAANAVGARFGEFRLVWQDWHQAWFRIASRNFPDEFATWHATLPPGVAIELSPNLAGLLDAPLRATVDFSAIPAEGAGHDWFDLTVALRVEDTTLTAEEIALLLKSRGKWVRLKRGWRRLELAAGAGITSADEAAATLDRLGLGAADVLETGKSATHRLHALQLAGEAAALESRDAKLAAGLRDRAARLAAIAPPALPAGLTATLRPYQVEGFHFLAHLAAQGFGGVLADDMGLGKTVQTLAWLLHLRATSSRERERVDSPFRALVVCPKSVTHGWLAETARFAPALTAAAFTPALAAAKPPSPSSNLPSPITDLLVANYTQLRLAADWFQSIAWDAVVLDEGQFIKNPTSQGAAAARALPARHRLVLTGTPVENRLTDLWSLFAFAQPGLLGTQPAFKRQYPADDAAALARLRRRSHHFLLRRTKAQAAPDLPPRTEDDLVVELEPAQRKLYDAELKRARATLLGIETDRALDQVRFNILASLLRLRQICCHPALIDPAHADTPSAKLDALLERLEELKEEGHQVLVFSQFVEMLELIRARLAAAEIGHLILTGATENRAALVDTFQTDRTKTVFLLSLKAAGFGLNLTAASYAILYDPWWNPAVEAQAIDRTHRIGQTRPVIAYRLLADNTVEQKIRALQKEKAALASAVVQEESLASVMDLDSLRKILA
ncbi:MAG: DEAD/DEAH box helicase [Verrucomicrobia bacterium]|nr:DEAD/DEAH box helicase [Verrucomicrobiota bacterium]